MTKNSKGVKNPAQGAIKLSKIAKQLKEGAKKEKKDVKEKC